MLPRRASVPSATGKRIEGRPSRGQMARLGVPVGGRVRMLRAVGDQPAHPLRETRRKEKLGSVSAFLLPLTASASSLLRQSRLETLLARRGGEPRKKFIVLDARSREPTRPPPERAEEENSVSSSFPSPQSRLANFALPAKVRAKAMSHPERDREKEVLRGLHKIPCASIQRMD